MGLFGGIGKIFQKAAKAIATGGISLVAPKLIPRSIDRVLNQITAAQFPTSARGIISTGLAAYTGNPSLLASNYGGAQPMSLNIGGILGQVGGILQGSNTTQNPYVQGFGQLLSLSGTVASSVQRQPGRPIQSAVAGAVTQLPAVARGLTKEVVEAGGKLLFRLGIPVKNINRFTGLLRRALASIMALARRTPAGTIVSILLGLGLTAYEANLLTAWHAQKKRRRMNPSNSRALRRAARRIKSFHRMCVHLDMAKTRRSSSAGRFQRCTSCRKSPCAC